MRIRWILGTSLLCFDLHLTAQQPAPPDYTKLCAICHGEAADGTDRGPALANNRALRRRSETQIRNVIRNGTSAGMPPFPLPDDQLDPLVRFVRSLNQPAAEAKPAGDVAAGSKFFFGKGQCSTCHMVQGRGKSNGPDFSDIGRQLTLREIENVLDDPTKQIGARSTPSCPG
jgi:mono/diheme cytochrome c family protein